MAKVTRDLAGVISSIIEYKDNMKHGSYQSYKFGGKPYIFCNYVKDKMEGEYIQFFGWSHHGEAQIEIKTFYKDDMKHGLFERYHPNGELFVQCEYSNDILHGNYQEWTPEGLQIEDCEYVNGKKIHNLHSKL